MEIYPVTEEEMEEIQKLSKTGPEKIKEDVKVLEEWIKTQPHLPQKFQFDGLLERALAQSFYKVELAKKRIDLHFTYKGRNKDFYELFGSDKFVLPSENCLTFAPLPDLLPGCERIYVGHLRSMDPEDYNMDHVIQVTVGNLELSFKHETTNRVLFVIDCGGFTSDFICKVEVSRFIRMLAHVQEAYITRIMGVHIINASSSIQWMITLAKRVIPGKYFNKMYIHEDLDALHEVVSPKYLPKEFGGSKGPLSEIMKKMDAFMLENKALLVESINYVADESKRPNSEYDNGSTFGVDIFF